MPTFRPGKPWLTVSVAGVVTVTPAATLIAWDNIDGQDPAWWSLATPTDITIPLDGMYHCVLNGERDSASAVTNIQNCSLEVNGVVLARQWIQNANTLTQDIGGNCAFLEQLQAGDVIRARYVATAALTTLMPVTTRLSIARVGPVRWTG